MNNLLQSTKNQESIRWSHFACHIMACVFHYTFVRLQRPYYRPLHCDKSTRESPSLALFKKLGNLLVKSYRTWTSSLLGHLEYILDPMWGGEAKIVATISPPLTLLSGPHPCAHSHALTPLTNSLEPKPSISYKKGGSLTQIFSVFACTSLLICTLGRSPCPLEALLPYLTLTLKEILSFPLVG